MTAVPTLKADATPEPLVRLPRIPWPDGTTWFAFRTWVALAVALYAVFLFELDGASSAGVCVLILAQPQQGMVLSKAIYRFGATIIGVVIAITLTALFPQDRTMLLASFALAMAFQTALGSIFRDFRSYACILAGYTIAIISVANIDAPTQVFAASVNRVAAIVVGIAAVAVTNAFLATAESSRSLIAKLRTATHDVSTLALETIDRRRPPEPETCIDLAARLMPLRGEITFATPEKPNGRARAKGARSALLGLLEMISAIQAVGAGLRNLDGAPSAIVDVAIDIARKALRLQNPEKTIPELRDLARPAVEAGTLSMGEAFVIERVHYMIVTLGNVRDGLRALRIGRPPRRDVAIEVHQDWFAVVLNAVRIVVALGLVSALSVWSGLADTATAILFTAVFVSLGAVQPDPRVMGKTALLGMPAVVVVGAIYAFFVFPLITGYPLFIVSLAPLVVAMCWFVKIGMGGAGLIFGVQTLVLVAPANLQTLDPTTFVATATMLTVSGIAIFLSFLLVLPGPAGGAATATGAGRRAGAAPLAGRRRQARAADRQPALRPPCAVQDMAGQDGADLRPRQDDAAPRRHRHAVARGAPGLARPRPGAALRGCRSRRAGAGHLADPFARRDEPSRR